MIISSPTVGIAIATQLLAHCHVQRLLIYGTEAFASADTLERRERKLADAITLAVEQEVAALRAEIASEQA